MTPPPRLLLAVALGGALGASLRHLSGVAFPDGDGFPWTTFAINLTGSALLAGLEFLAIARASRVWAAGLGPGLLGGFTTFSATSEQARVLLTEGEGLVAATYLLGTLAACLVAVSAIGLVAPPLPEEDEL